ncbi:unnamed protein product [Ixodes persulcatus]
MDPVDFRQMFRFEQVDVQRLRKALAIPERVRNAQRVEISGDEALCIALRRLSYPVRLCDMRREFGRAESTLSLFANSVLKDIVAAIGPLLGNFARNPWLTSTALEEFSHAVQQKGAPLPNCWGFIDGTARAMCRPSRDQRAYFSGHKRFHALKYQSIMCPNGIIVHLHGSHKGSAHDAGILRDSRLMEQLEELIPAEQFVLYGDPAYPLTPLVFKPYAGSKLTNTQACFNKSMRTVRQCVEWGFRKVVNEFAFIDFKKNQKLLKQPLEKISTQARNSAVILANCHTCLYSSQTSMFFSVQPPSLEEYLAT